MENNLGVQWVSKTVPVAELKPFEKNPRKIGADEFAKLKKSLAEDGYHQRIIATSDLRVIGGHQRIKALKELGITTIEVLVADREISDQQFRRILVRDNLSYGEWLPDMLGDLMPLGEMLEIGVPAAVIGKIGTRSTAGLTDDDEVPELPPVPVSAPGDVWLLGPHRVMCGDSTSLDAVSALMDGDRAAMLLTDPPYNIAYEGKTKDALTIENDDMSSSDFREFLRAALSCADAVMKPGAIFYVWHADTEGYNFRGACSDIGWQVRQCLIWQKSTMVMSRQDYHWQHEPCLYGWKSGASHLWLSDRKQTTLLKFDKPSRNGEHPTMKPVEMMAYQIENHAKEGDIILDLFGGSGSTLIAADKLQCHARLMELDPKYVDVIVTRWQAFAGKQARHQATGLTFDEMNAAKITGKRDCA